MAKRRKTKIKNPILTKPLFTVHGVTFSQDMDGNILSSTLGRLGHEEDVLEIGQQLVQFAELLNENLT